MNPILNEIIENRNGFYVHAVEVTEVYELEAVAEQIITEYQDRYTTEVIIDFLESLTVYYLGEDEQVEEQVYEFSFREYIEESL